MAKKKTRVLKPGIYNAMVDKVVDNGNGSVTVHTIMYGKGFTFTERFTTKPIKETDPDAGHERFFVSCDRLAIYTSIGADNRHHASNKATKLFGPNWSRVHTSHYLDKEFKFVPVKEFKELLKTLPN